MSTWFLAIDFGTSNTCAAIVTDAGAVPVGFGPSQVARMPSGVLLKPNGTLVVGFEAQRHAPLHPEWYDPSPKRSVGQTTMLLGDREVQVVDVVAAVLAAAAAEARRQRGGVPPAQVSLTYPARWGTTRQSVLRDAATRAGLGDVVLVSEPEAAAAYFAKHDRVPAGRAIAVYDLGGGTLDVAVLVATDHGFRLTGRPGGIDPFGGEDIDQRLLDLTLDRAAQAAPGADDLVTPPDTEWRAHAAALRERVRCAKEDLSAHDPAELVLPGVGSTAELSRADLRSVAGGDIEASVTEFLRVVERAGVAVPELAGAYLAGGSSRLPIVREAMAAQLPQGSHRLVRTLNDPKAAVAQGAAELLYGAESLPAGGPSPELARVRKPRRPLRWYHLVVAALIVLALLIGLVVWFDQRESNVVSGTVRDSNGDPLANVKVVVADGGALGKSFETTTDGDGHYSGKLPRGSYQIQASVTFDHSGVPIDVPLAPHDPGKETVDLPTRGGADLDWDVRVAGKDTLDATATGYYGLSINVGDFPDLALGVYSLSVLSPEQEVTFHLEPVGPLVDGSPSAPIEFTRTIGELIAGSGLEDGDAYLHDVPLASYVLTATVETVDGPRSLVFEAGADGFIPEFPLPLPQACPVGCVDATWGVGIGVDPRYFG